MSSMTIPEKVARAIHDNPDPIWTVVDWNAMHPDAQALIMRQATAAIHAFLAAATEEGWHMRPDEATPTMLAAAAKTPVKTKGRSRAPLYIYLEEVNLNMQHFEKARCAMLAAAPKFEWDK